MSDAIRGTMNKLKSFLYCFFGRHDFALVGKVNSGTFILKSYICRRCSTRHSEWIEPMFNETMEIKDDGS
jgi:hypothetical protein